MSIFDKLFKTKVEDIMTKAKCANQLLSAAEKDIAELKASPRHIIIRDEILILLQRHHWQSVDIGRQCYNINFSNDYYEQQNIVKDTEKKIKDLLNELCKEANNG